MPEYNAKTTTDHKVIKNWAEERGGIPTYVTGTVGEDKAGILRIDFDDREENLKGISWDDFFEKFEENHLKFLYQDQTKDGETSRFFKLVDRDT